MEKPAESKKPCFLLSLAVLVPSLVFTFLILGFSVFLVTTVTTVFLSTIFIVRFSKKKVAIVRNPAQKEQEQVAEQVSTTTEIENVAQSQESEEISHIHEYQVEAADFPSDSESSDGFSATGNFEPSWMLCSSNVGQSISESSSVSDDDFDDQDGDDLIEISLPMSNSVDFHAVSKKNSQSNLPDYLPENLMELWEELNEANEEDNLIEIDLSMDSIKSSISED